MTETFKSERERLEKERAHIVENIDDCESAECPHKGWDEALNNVISKLTQLNEDEEICREEIKECKKYGLRYADNEDDENEIIEDEDGEYVELEELKQNLFGGENENKIRNN